jgi:hypothetical protein
MATPNIESQLQSNTANSMADMQKRYTANSMADMQEKYGWMTMDFSKFGAARF